MDPKELAKLYEKKSAESAAKAAENKAQMDVQQAEFRKRVEQGRTALRDVVIPYFQELVSAFPKGQFKFNPSASMEAETLAPVAVSFKIGDGPEHFIEVAQGTVRIYYNYNTRPQPEPQARKVAKGGKPVPAPGVVLQMVYSGNTEPFIATPTDLTRDKLAKLVEVAISKT
jgi:hypothetical protein